MEDLIVTNAFTVLEDTLREKVKVSNEYYGKKLIDYCFNPKEGKITLGDTDSEKNGVYMLFSGMFSYLRNPNSHTLKFEEDSDSALKIMYIADFLLGLIEKSQVK